MKKLIYLIGLSVMLFSCEKESSSDYLEASLTEVKTSNLILDQECAIDGPITAAPGSTLSYTLTTTLPDVVWGSTTPNISFQSTSDNSATVSFSNTFSGGTIFVQTSDSSNPLNNCDDSLDIDKAGGSGCILETPSADGPDYMGTKNWVIWEYTGNVINPSTIQWWYRKVNDTGVAPFVIAFGETAVFSTTSDTFYSDTSLRISVFEIYVIAEDCDGKRYRSPTYNIMKKGRYKLGGAFDGGGPSPF